MKRTRSYFYYTGWFLSLILSIFGFTRERKKEKEYDKEIGRNKTKTMRKKLYEIIKRLNKHN